MRTQCRFDFKPSQYDVNLSLIPGAVDTSVLDTCPMGEAEAEAVAAAHKAKPEDLQVPLQASISFCTPCSSLQDSIRTASAFTESGRSSKVFQKAWEAKPQQGSGGNAYYGRSRLPNSRRSSPQA